MSRLDDPNHYQHTTRATVPAAPRRYRPGDYVTVIPNASDPMLLHMQRQVTIVDEPTPGHYRVELGAVSTDQRIQGPIPADRLLPGWVEQNGQKRYGERGRRQCGGWAPS